MPGLKRVKDIATTMYQNAMDNKLLREQGRKEAIVGQTYNFVFAGNPGCGKTTVARIFADLLKCAGVREGNLILEKKGAECLQMGAKKFAELIAPLIGTKNKKGPATADLPKDRFLKNQLVEVEVEGKWWPAKVHSLPCPITQDAVKKKTYEVMYAEGEMIDQVHKSKIRPVQKDKGVGGVLFIDEAYDLDPVKNPEGRLILAQIMDIAEEYRDTVTVILAGYKDDIDNKIFSFNLGMASRFETVPFDDFSEDELEAIWRKFCAEGTYEVDDKVCAVVRRRLKRMSGMKGFGNARAARKMFEKASVPAKRRFRETGGGVLDIIVTDVIGLSPTRTNIPELDSALTDLDKMVGIPEVKKSIYMICETAKRNYEHELEGTEIGEQRLNRLFVGKLFIHANNVCIVSNHDVR
jgi:DNA polymerase III delta prime subunit